MLPEVWSATDRIFCHFGPLLAFYPPSNSENQNFEKIKTPGDFMILNMCTKDDNHMMYAS